MNKRVPIPEKIRRVILSESDGCSYCESWNASEIDHVVPVCQGGTNDVNNLVAACFRCNAEKSGRTPEQWRLWREACGLSWPPRNVNQATDFMLRWPTGLMQRAEVVARAARNDPTSPFMLAVSACRDRYFNESTYPGDIEDRILRATLEDEYGLGVEVAA